MRKRLEDDEDLIWVRVDEVRHWRSGKLIRRKDGQPFVFPIRRRKKKK